MSTLLEMRIDELEEQNAALAAQVEALKDWRLLALKFDGHRMQAMSTLKMVATGNFNMGEVRQFIAAAPVSGDEHLRQVRAEAGRDGYVRAATMYLESPQMYAMGSIDSFADKYHASILSGKE